MVLWSLEVFFNDVKILFFSKVFIFWIINNWDKWFDKGECVMGVRGLSFWIWDVLEKFEVRNCDFYRLEEFIE